MGIGDNNTVAITIQVVDANSGQAIQGVETKLVGLGATGAAVGEQLSSTTQKLVGFSDAIIRTGGAAGAVDPSLAALRAQALQMQQALTSITTQAIETAAALNAVGEAAQRGGARLGQSLESTHGSMRQVSGMAREIGLNFGYSMRHAISENEALMSGLSALEGLFVAIAAVDIATQMIEGAHRLYEKWFDVDKAVDDYRQKAAEAATEKLIDTSSLETTISLLDQVNNQVTQLEQKKAAVGADLPGGGFFQYFQGMRPVGRGPIPGHLANVNQAFDPLLRLPEAGPVPRYTVGDSQQQASDMHAADSLAAHKRELQSGLSEQQLKDQQRIDEAATHGYGQIAKLQHDADEQTSAHFDQLRANAEALSKIINASPEAQKLGVKVTPEQLKNQYNTQEQAGYDTNFADASAKRIQMSQQESDEVIRLRNQAADAGLKGETLYNRQRLEAIDDFVRKYGDSSEMRQAIDQKYESERLAREQSLQQKLQSMQQDAAAAWLTGLPKIQAEQQKQLNSLYTDGGGDLGFMFKGAQIVQQQTNQEMVQAQQQFTEKIQQIEQSSQSQMLSGYAKIAAQEKQILDGLAEDYKKQGDTSAAAAQQYAGARLAIEQNADRERQQYSQQVNEQITQTEAQAARLILPPWQAAQQQIADEYAQRLQKIRTDIEQHVISEQQGAREVNAAWALANAQMQKEAEQSRNQIAGQLEQLFSDPAKYMQNRAKQMMMDILANWVVQLENAKGRMGEMGGIVGGLLGQNPMGTGSPKHALSAMFAGKHGESTDLPTAQFASAGSTMSSAGTTMYAAATMQMNAAQAITAAAAQFGGSNPLASGGFGGMGGSGGGWTGIGDMPSMGSPSLWGSDSTAGVNGGSSGAYSVSGTATGGAAGAANAALAVPQGMTNSQMAMSAGNTVLQGLQLVTMLKTAGASGTAGAGGAPSMNLGGDDDNPTNDYGMGGGSDSDSGSSQGGSASRALGMAGGLISGGMGLFSAWQSASNSKTFAGGLTSMIGGAMSGAMIGTMFAPGIGTAIGAAAGAMVGLMGDIFGDHGRSKAQQYNIATVIPGLQKAMDGFSSGGSSYDSASQEIAGLQTQAQNQCKQWGSGAWDFYKGTITPEITAAQNQVNREGQGGRSNVTMSAAQFDSGGVVRSFGDFSTGPHSGFIHVTLGERVMNPMASMMYGSTLDAMNSGVSSMLRMQRTEPLGGGDGGVHHHHHYNINALDLKSFESFLRGGAGKTIQTNLNQLAGQYAGRALNVY